MSTIEFNGPDVSGTPESRGLFAGTVKVNGSPAAKRVLLLDRRTFIPVVSTHALADGTWQIKGLPLDDAAGFLCVVVDDTGEFNAEVADHLTMFNDGA